MSFHTFLKMFHVSDITLYLDATRVTAWVVSKFACFLIFDLHESSEMLASAFLNSSVYKIKLWKWGQGWMIFYTPREAQVLNVVVAGSNIKVKADITGVASLQQGCSIPDPQARSSPQSSPQMCQVS